VSGQTKLGSMAEAWTNVVVGFGINYAGNIFILPALGVPMSTSKAFHIGLIFTVISVARSYGLRRVYNKPFFRRLFGKEDA